MRHGLCSVEQHGVESMALEEQEGLQVSNSQKLSCDLPTAEGCAKLRRTLFPSFISLMMVLSEIGLFVFLLLLF